MQWLNTCRTLVRSSLQVQLVLRHSRKMRKRCQQDLLPSRAVGPRADCVKALQVHVMQ